MKKFTKVIAVILSAMFVVACFAGCSSNSAKTEEANYNLLTDGTLVVGTNAEFPPFEFVGDDGNPDGFDMALIKAIGEKLGLTVQVSNMEFDSLVAAIGTKIDVSIAGMTITDERKEAVDFSDSYYEAVQYVLVKNGTTVSSMDDLSGKTIGVQLGTTGDFDVEALMEKDKTVTEKQYDKGIQAVQDLENGKIDAVVIDKNPAEVFASEYSDLQTIDGSTLGFDVEDYAIAIPKGNTALTEAINKAIVDLKADGTYDKLVKQYITDANTAE